MLKKLFTVLAACLLTLGAAIGSYQVPVKAEGSEDKPQISAAKIYTSLNGGTLVCDLLDGAPVAELSADTEYYLRVTVNTAIGNCDWVSIELPNQLYYTNTPGLTVGAISHTSLCKVLSYKDAAIEIDYQRDNGAVKYEIKENAVLASFFIGFMVDGNYYNGDTNGMSIADAITISTGKNGTETPTDTISRNALEKGSARTTSWFTAGSFTSTSGVLDSPVTGFQNYKPFVYRTNNGAAGESLGIFTATYTLTYDAGATLNSVFHGKILSTIIDPLDATKKKSYCSLDLQQGYFYAAPVITYPSASFALGSYTIGVSDVKITMDGDTSGFDASMGIGTNTLTVNIVDSTVDTFTPWASNAGTYNWRRNDTDTKSYATASDRLSWLGFAYDNPVKASGPMTLELFIDEGNTAAGVAAGQGLIHFATLPAWDYQSVYWEAVNVNDPTDTKSGTINAADLDLRQSTHPADPNYKDYYVIAVDNDLKLDSGVYSLTYLKAAVKSVPAASNGTGPGGVINHWYYYIDCMFEMPAVFGTFRSADSQTIYTRFKVSTAPDDNSTPVTKLEETSLCYPTGLAGSTEGIFTAGRAGLPEASYTVLLGEDITITNLTASMGDFYYNSGWTGGGTLKADTSTVIDPILYLILPQGIGDGDLELTIGGKKTDYTITDITADATNPGNQTIYKISFSSGTAVGYYDENGNDRRLGINVKLTTSYNTTPGSYSLSDMFFLGNLTVQAGHSGPNGSVGPTGDTYVINGGLPYSRVIVENTKLTVQENDTVIVDNACSTYANDGTQTAVWTKYDSYNAASTTTVLTISKSGYGELRLDITNLVAAGAEVTDLKVYIPISKIGEDMGVAFMSEPQQFSVTMEPTAKTDSSAKFDYAYGKLTSPCDGSGEPVYTAATTAADIEKADLLIVTLKANETLVNGIANTQHVYFKVKTVDKDVVDGAVNLFTPLSSYTANNSKFIKVNDIVGFSVKACTVTYNANGGINAPVDPDSPYEINDTVTIKDKETMTYDGYEFIGWNTKSDGGGDDYTPAQTFKITKSMIFYAKWKQINSLVVTKTVDSGDKEKEFCFVIRVMEKDGSTPLTGTYEYSGGSIAAGVAQPGDGRVTFNEEGKATIVLKHGQSITFDDLPAGTIYTITENAQTGWTSQANSASGTVKGVVTASFINTYKPDHPNTGDDSRLLTMAILLLISGAGLAFLNRKEKRS